MVSVGKDPHMVDFPYLCWVRGGYVPWFNEGLMVLNADIMGCITIANNVTVLCMCDI